MTLKAKLFSTIAAFCLVACLMVIGVFAASTVNVSMSGNISFAATDVFATVSGTVTGTKSPVTLSDIDFAGSESDGEVKSWSDLNWEFADKETDIVINITVTNKHTENKLTTVLDEEALTAAFAGKNIDVELTSTNAASTDLNKVGGTTTSITYTITLSIADTNKAVNAVWSVDNLITLTNGAVDVAG